MAIWEGFRAHELENQPAPVADAFCASRLDAEHGLSFGTLPARAPLRALIERSTPRL